MSGPKIEDGYQTESRAMRDKPTQFELEQAVRGRLAKLSTTPVDMSRLAHQLDALMAKSTASEPQRWCFPMVWRPVSAAAAAVLIAAAIGIIVATVGHSPAVAAPGHLAQLHAEAIRSDSMATAVSSVEEANRVLAGQWDDLPSIPIVDTATLHACCIHDFMDDRVVCLVLRDGFEPLTMVVGRARSFRPTKGREVIVGGRKYYIHRVDGLLMAMTQQDSRFVCLMGEVTEDRLLHIVGKLRF